MIDHFQLLNHLSIGVVVLDESLNVVLWNRWMGEHSMLSSEEVEGKPLVSLFPALVRKGFVKKAKEVFRSGRPVFFTQKVNQYIFPFPTPRSYLTNKLTIMQQTVILSPIKNNEELTTHVLVSVFDVSDWVEHQNQLLKSKAELEKLSQSDELTQIPNRRAIMEKLQEEVSLHNRKGVPLAVAMVDVDHFKEINDTYGHQCGDHILFELANLMNNGLRGYDMAGRYGGEEFLVVLPDTEKDQAVQVSDRLRKKVADTIFFCNEQKIHLTISIGIALKDAHVPTTVEKLLKAADDCLYQAKSAGRNRTILS